ncbi:hypothetical protein [Defluviimonas sp. WL0075]|uniref:Secreted protein n=1 Tax=Albidovulum sediminicola TaxID=2984331 RepID=A0ABT2Z4K2_9RHOB|nr:hypothetical protein [Defluviimonas sp. WL0075]MCV2866064.1 hypothetical protein [Defluviimonas sp. WL0075]
MEIAATILMVRFLVGALLTISEITFSLQRVKELSAQRARGVIPVRGDGCIIKPRLSLARAEREASRCNSRKARIAASAVPCRLAVTH